MRTARGLVRILGALVLLVVLAMAVPAEGADGANLWPRQVTQDRPSDAADSDPTKITLTFASTGEQSPALAAKVTERIANGPETDVGVAPTVLPSSEPRSVALVIDASTPNDDTGQLAASRDAAKAAVAASPGTRFSVIVANDKSTVVARFTSDAIALNKAIDAIAPSPGGAGIWEAMRIAGESLKEEDGQPNIIAFLGSNDSIAPADEPSGTSAVVTSGASLFAILNTNTGFNPAPYQSLVQRSGGTAVGVDANGVGEATDAAMTIIRDKQYTLTYDSKATAGQLVTNTVDVGGTVIKTQVVCCSTVSGVERLTPAVTTSGGGIEFLQGTLGLIIVLVVVLVAAAALAYGLASIFVQDQTLSNVLQPYADAYSDEDDEGTPSIANNALIQRGVTMVENVARDQGLLARTEGALERANLPLRAGEALFFYLALVVVITVVGLFLTGGILGGLVVGGIAALVPISVVNFLAGRRRKAFMAQLPDMLSLLSGTLRAGYSLMQGIEAVSQEVTDPMGIELRRVVTEARLGRPLEEALETSAERMDSPDFGWAIMAIRIQREVGGNLSELLMTVADTMIARERLRRDVAALTAEGRVSAVILGLLPLGLGAIMFVLNKEYTSVLFNDTLGQVMLGLAIVAMGIGFLWMRKIINIEI
jgi:tight adherence protein B